MANRAFLWANDRFYRLVRPLVFRRSAQDSHEKALALLRWLDDRDWAQAVLKRSYRMAFDERSVSVGGVRLPHPLILAAGFIKGDGFESEAAALAAVESGRNVIPGWRSMPALVGPVELGSFTRWPRMGNPGTVMWRDVATRSTQNRVGLRNPGAKAAAAFLARHRQHLPPVYGINIATSPGVSDIEQQTQEVLGSMAFFGESDISPAWFTLNLSCPNTEDDPTGNQTETLTRRLCEAAVNAIDVPLWVKIGPGLADSQYAILMRVFAEAGVRAVIATNTLAKPSPANVDEMAGVGGGLLHDCAVAATIRLTQEKQRHAYPVDVTGCGGVMDSATWRAFGTQAAQYWSALIYRGPLAAALILNEDNS